jgi:hypothetical protein
VYGGVITDASGEYISSSFRVEQQAKQAANFHQTTWCNILKIVLYIVKGVRISDLAENKGV